MKLWPFKRKPKPAESINITINTNDPTVNALKIVQALRDFKRKQGGRLDL